MEITGILVACVIGAICGWLAGQIMSGRGLGLVGNIVVGIVGGLLFSYLASVFKISIGSGLISQIVGGTLGAVLLLVGISFIKKNT